MQCIKCNFVEDNLDMMEANRPCPNCGYKKVKLLFSAKHELQSVYADIVQSFFEYDQKYQNNKKVVIVTSDNYNLHWVL